MSTEIDLESALAELIEERHDASAEHPEPGELAAYVASELGGDDEARVRRHLEGCRECVAMARDLALARAPADDRPADFETAAAWRGMRRRLAEEDRAAAPAPPPVSVVPSPRWAQTLAAVLTLAVLGLGAWATRLHQTRDELRHTVAELEAPQTALPILYFDAVTRAGDEELPAVPAGAQTFALIVTPPTEPAYERYAIAIENAAGDVVWRGDDLVASEYGTLRLLLSRRLLPAGEYRLVLTGTGENDPLARYSLTIR